jgi:dTDP-4-dehydrorhamnose reductase
VLHVAGPEALSRHALGRLVAAAHGRDPEAVPAGRLAASGLVRPADLRLEVGLARATLATRLRGATEVLRPA